MQFSAKGKEHLDSCRFCWMCRHICPIGNATGQERNTSRARALGLSLVARDAIPYSEDIIDNVYECAMCAACVKECVTGWDPILFTREARLGAALDGKLPAYIQTLLQNLAENGNPYGKEDPAVKEIVAALPKKADTLLFFGADARAKYVDGIKNAVALLQKAGVEFTALADEPNSGYAWDFCIGAANETKQAMQACAKVLNNYKTVVCYDACDAKIINREYKEWGIDCKAKAISFPAYIAELIAAGKLNVKKTDASFTPQDSHLLARELEEIQPMRDVLGACGNIQEMLLWGKDTMLAGNLLMETYIPEVMAQVAKDRWTNALNMNAKTVVTASVAEYLMLKKTCPENAEVKAIEEVVLQCL